MRIVIGLDNAGFALKEDILPYLEGFGLRGSRSRPAQYQSCRFSRYAESVGLAIQRG
jgi:ribose 5-phosphate isomerase RpiB